MSNVTLTPFLIAQIIGFPIAFLVRCFTRLWRARKAELDDARSLRLEALANLCFALMSIAFAFVRPVGVLLLIAGVGLTFTARLPRLRRQPEAPAPSTSIKNSKLSRGRRPSKLMA